VGDLIFSGTLNLSGTLKLSGDGGKVKVDTNEVLVTVKSGEAGKAQGAGAPVVLPPPPATPADLGTDIWIFNTSNSTVTINGSAIVTLGDCMQGGKGSSPGQPTWPGTVLPSSNNSSVKINNIAINVQGDQGTILANGSPVNFTQCSGQ
jgi:hypothetical protein